MVRDTSIVTYNKIIEEGLVGDNQKRVLDYLRENPDCTDMEIATGLGFEDPNHTRPRRKELLDAQIVESNGKRECSITGRVAYQWRVKDTLRIEAIRRAVKGVKVREQATVDGKVLRPVKSKSMLEVLAKTVSYFDEFPMKKYGTKILDAGFSQGVYFANLERRT